MKPIIEIKNISKQYKIGGSKESYLSLRESLFNIKHFFSKEQETFWALNDISYDIMPGESLGIIGRNGAGKSTLLKILSRITPPTKGSIKMRGRVASLLEVGTGFHPELTGRENIYLNGSILGMKRNEIKSQFDNIVDFSGISSFLDTPLKHYSSGMQLRLAFSVAAHLEPEILLIDEILAVGDAEFQKKCLGKMDDIVNNGRTVLFVSHDLSAIKQLSSKGLWLDGGKVMKNDSIEKTISAYQSWISNSSNNEYEHQGHSDANSIIEKVAIGQKSYNIGIPISLLLDVDTKIKINQLIFGISIHNENGYIIGSKVDDSIGSLEKGKQQFSFHIDNIHLAPGVYSISIAIAETSPYNVLHSLKEVVYFDISPVLNQEFFAWDKSFGNIVMNGITIKKC